MRFCNNLIKKLNAKRFLKYIYKTFKKVNDVSVLRYTIIKLKSEKYKVLNEYIEF